MSIMPLSICKELKLSDLRPTTLVIQLADGSIRHPTGVLEDIPVQLGNSVVPCDFVVLEVDESSQAPVILGRPFLATTRAVIDVRDGIISFQLGGERVDFCFPPPTPSLLPITSSSPEAHVHTMPPNATLGTTVFDGNSGTSMLPTTAHDAHPPIPTDLGISSIYTGEVVNFTSQFYNSSSRPPEPSLFSIWR